MQYMCCCGLSLKYVSSTCNISYISSKAFPSILVEDGSGNVSWLVTCKQPTFSVGMRTFAGMNVVVSGPRRCHRWPC